MVVVKEVLHQIGLKGLALHQINKGALHAIVIDATAARRWAALASRALLAATGHAVKHIVAGLLALCVATAREGRWR